MTDIFNVSTFFTYVTFEVLKIIFNLFFIYGVHRALGQIASVFLTVQLYM